MVLFSSPSEYPKSSGIKLSYYFCRLLRSARTFSMSGVKDLYALVERIVFLFKASISLIDYPCYSLAALLIALFFTVEPIN
jgi:hypothetical protein